MEGYKFNLLPTSKHDIQSTMRIFCLKLFIDIDPSDWEGL